MGTLAKFDHWSFSAAVYQLTTSREGNTYC